MLIKKMSVKKLLKSNNLLPGHMAKQLLACIGFGPHIFSSFTRSVLLYIHLNGERNFKPLPQGGCVKFPILVAFSTLEILDNLIGAHGLNLLPSRLHVYMSRSTFKRKHYA